MKTNNQKQNHITKRHGYINQACPRLLKQIDSAFRYETKYINKTNL